MEMSRNAFMPNFAFPRSKQAWLSWLEKLGTKRTLILGIDQGTYAIRYALLDTTKEEIIKWGSFDLTGTPGGEKNNFQAIIKGLAKEVPLANLGAVNLNVQGNAVTLGRLQIPVAETKNEAQIIRLALREQLSYRVEDAVFVYREVLAYQPKAEGKPSATEAKRTFNFAAIEKNALSAMMEPIVDAFKLIPNICIQGYAHEQLISKFKLAREDETVGFINMGRGVTAICIFRNHRLVFQRDIPLAGQDITRAILIMHRDAARANQMLTLGEAEQLKCRLIIPAGGIRLPANEAAGKDVPAGDNPHEQLFHSIQGVMAAWVQDIRLTFQHFYDYYQGPTLSRVYLLGGSANLGNLPAYLQHELAIETRILEFPKDHPLHIAEDAANFKERFHEHATALAYAIKAGPEGNLVQQNMRQAEHPNFLIPVFRLIYIFAIAVFLTWYGFLSTQSFYLKDVKQALSEHHQFLERIQLPYFEMIKWKKFLDEADGDSRGTSLILKALSRTTPQNLLLSTIAINQDSHSLMVEGVIFGDPKGRAITIADYSEALKETSLLTQIEVPQMDPVGVGDKEGTFRLTARIVTEKKKTS